MSNRKNHAFTLALYIALNRHYATYPEAEVYRAHIEWATGQQTNQAIVEVEAAHFSVRLRYVVNLTEYEQTSVSV